MEDFMKGIPRINFNCEINSFVLNKGCREEPGFTGTKQEARAVM
jgi:hypothetical protein